MITTTQISIDLPAPHHYQREILADPSRFKVVACGRRWGKTTLALVAVVEEVLRGGFVWWVMPTYKLSTEVWRDLKTLLKAVTVAKSETERRIEVIGGGSVSIKSADDPDSLRGVGLNLVVVDEAAFIHRDAWTAALRPTLSDTGGSALLLGTPKGRNWYYHAFLRGQSELPGWRSWQLPTSTSPTVPEEELIEARSSLPAQIFAQEYLAEFTEDAGMVFRNVRNCIYDSYKDDGGRKVMGADWGQSNDFTVLTVMDSNHTVVDIDRFNQIDYITQRRYLRNMKDRHNVDFILAEDNSMGVPIIEELIREGLPVQAFHTTGDSKHGIIQALQLAFEQEQISIPDNPLLIAELEAFEAIRLPSGKWRYSAPSGMHDDMVVSLALAYEASNNSGPLFWW
jgi:phage FluMu gp28-like protein